VQADVSVEASRRIRFWAAVAGVLGAFILYWAGVQIAFSGLWWHALPFFGAGVWLHYMSLRSVS
jgi:hypothetical protein